MALINRITRLFSADLHAVLDRMEEPDIVLKQAVRDMQAAVADTDRQLRALKNREQQTAATRAAAQTRLDETQAELDVCLDAGNDELARSVLQRKLQLERSLADLESRAGQLQRSVSEHEAVLSRRRQELDALRSRAEAFESHDDHAAHAACTTMTSAEVEVALLREKQRRARS